MIEDAMQSSSTRMKKLPPMPKLTHEQRSLRSVRLSGQLGCAAGLSVGCVIGMIPLLFFPDEIHKKEKDGDEDGSSTSLANKDDQIRQLEKELQEWKGKYADVLEKVRVLEREKYNEALR